MKNQFLALCVLLSAAMTVSAQKEYKLAKTSGSLTLNLSGAIIEGYSGNEVIFSVPTKDEKKIDERAKGLREINGSGLNDNTGIGLDVSTKGEETTVNSVSKLFSNEIITIKVPQGIKISFRNSSVMSPSEVIVKNMKSEIDISTSYNKIKLENNTGPMNVKSLYGSIDAIFSGEVKGPVSIVSVYEYVDVTLPATTKANIEIATSYGKLYAADGLKIAVEPNINKANKTDKVSDIARVNVNVEGMGVINSIGSGARTYTNGSRLDVFGANSETIKGKINGGGADIILKSNYKNVYLREK